MYKLNLQNIKKIKNKHENPNEEILKRKLNTQKQSIELYYKRNVGVLKQKRK